MKAYIDIETIHWGLGLTITKNINIYDKYKFSLELQILCFTFQLDIIKNKPAYYPFMQSRNHIYFTNGKEIKANKIKRELTPDNKYDNENYTIPLNNDLH